MALKLANNAVSKLAAAILSTDTTLTLTPGDGAKFPVLAAGDWCPATLVKVDGTLEIVRVTARVNDALTIARAQEGTVALAFGSGDRVELRLTNAAIQEIRDTYLPKTGGLVTGTINFNGPPGAQLIAMNLSADGPQNWAAGREPDSGNRAFKLWYYDNIGSFLGAFTFDRAGNFTAPANVAAYSDIRIKANIEMIPGALDKVMLLRGVTFERTDIEGYPRQTGVIAQDVQKVLPEAVIEGDDGLLTVAYGNLVGLLIEAVKELRAEVRALKEAA